MSIIDLGLPPALTNEFADIFAWQIDFFHLYPGDKFKVIFEEEQIDGESIGIKDIKGAFFQHGYFIIQNFAPFVKTRGVPQPRNSVQGPG